MRRSLILCGLLLQSIAMPFATVNTIADTRMPETNSMTSQTTEDNTSLNASAAEDNNERPSYTALEYVTLGQYTGLSVEVDAITISDQDIQSAIEQAVADYGLYDTLYEGIVKEGDIANIDYTGKKDGIAFEGGTAQGYDLTIGSGVFIDGFETGLIGISIGDTVDLDLTFPENYASEYLAGQDVVFSVTVNSVQRIPEITNDVVYTVSDGAYKTIEEYNEYQHGQVMVQKKEEQEAAIRNGLMAQLYSTCTINDYPDDLITYSVDTLRNYYMQMASDYEMSFADFLPLYYGIDVETFESESAEAVKESLQQELILSAIAEQEKLEISDDEYIEGCRKYADRMGYTTVDEFLAAYGEKEIRHSLIMDKAMDYVVTHAVVTVRGTKDKPDSEAIETVSEQTQPDEKKEAVLLKPAVIRSEPAISFETLLELRAGEIVEIVEICSEKHLGTDWCIVEKNGIQGYIQKSKLSFDSIEVSAAQETEQQTETEQITEESEISVSIESDSAPETYDYLEDMTIKELRALRDAIQSIFDDPENELDEQFLYLEDMSVKDLRALKNAIDNLLSNGLITESTEISAVSYTKEQEMVKHGYEAIKDSLLDPESMIIYDCYGWDAKSEQQYEKEMAAKRGDEELKLPNDLYAVYYHVGVWNRAGYMTEAEYIYLYDLETGEYKASGEKSEIEDASIDHNVHGQFVNVEFWKIAGWSDHVINYKDFLNSDIIQ